jgi:hypothetical protein
MKFFYVETLIIIHTATTETIDTTPLVVIGTLAPS